MIQNASIMQIQCFQQSTLYNKLLQYLPKNTSQNERKDIEKLRKKKILVRNIRVSSN
jgi:hypothetical protein